MPIRGRRSFLIVEGLVLGVAVVYPALAFDIFDKSLTLLEYHVSAGFYSGGRISDNECERRSHTSPSHNPQVVIWKVVTNSTLLARQ